jgi:hypothetical protein
MPRAGHSRAVRPRLGWAPVKNAPLTRAACFRPNARMSPGATTACPLATRNSVYVVPRQSESSRVGLCRRPTSPRRHNSANTDAIRANPHSRPPDDNARFCYETMPLLPDVSRSRSSHRVSLVAPIHGPERSESVRRGACSSAVACGAGVPPPVSARRWRPRRHGRRPPLDAGAGVWAAEPTSGQGHRRHGAARLHVDDVDPTVRPQ